MVIIKNIILLLILLLLTKCEEDNVINNEEDNVDNNKKRGIKALAGWDIYSGGIFRYGPSIIINDDNTIDAWFAAPGDKYTEYGKNNFNAGDDNHVPVELTPEATAAQKFSIDQVFYGLEVVCPTWGQNEGTRLTLSLYQWENAYEATVAGSPVITKTHIDFKDNESLTVTSDSGLPGGEYLWVLSDPGGEKVGVWKYPDDVEGVKNYFNGSVVSGSYEATIITSTGSVKNYWDQVAYRYSKDGGKTWSTDEMVLKPSFSTKDQLSVCDPGVAKWGGYYYLGYTSTEDKRGLDNNVFVARSEFPKGPWEKWNGSGWGGAPEPVITYTGSPEFFGAGEPCMVINNGTVYFYYSWNAGGKEAVTTRVATADENDPDWPAHLTLHGTAINKTGIAGSDHADIKYRDDIKKFQAIHTAARMTADSKIILWESEDGLTFERVGEVKGDLKPYLHNCGWSGDEKGHIGPAKQHYLSYAYGSGWAAWNTFWHPIQF
jgi:hypothetical protein